MLFEFIWFVRIVNDERWERRTNLLSIHAYHLNLANIFTKLSKNLKNFLSSKSNTNINIY